MAVLFLVERQSDGLIDRFVVSLPHCYGNKSGTSEHLPQHYAIHSGLPEHSAQHCGNHSGLPEHSPQRYGNKSGTPEHSAQRYECVFQVFGCLPERVVLRIDCKPDKSQRTIFLTQHPFITAT